MKNIKLFEQYHKINELFVHKTDDTDYDSMRSKRVIMYKGHVWIFSDDEWEDYNEEIADITGLDTSGDVVEFLNTLHEDNYHVLYGYLNDAELSLYSDTDFRHGKFSEDLRKLQKELGNSIMIKIKYMHGSNLDKYSSIDITGSELNDELKNKTVYHGTCLKFLPRIAKFGLMPTKTTNYKKIKHNNKDYTDKDNKKRNEGKIFLTANLEKAEGHAITASIQNNSFPVIIEVRIPDTSKIVYDYDLSVQYEGGEDDVSTKLGYTKVFKQEGGNNKKGNKSWKDTKTRDNLHYKLGAFGYIGRIPASYIESIWFDAIAYSEHLIAFEMGDVEIEYNSPIFNDIRAVSLWAEFDNYKEFEDKMNQLYDEAHDREFDFDNEDDDY
jgi:hypothetical protein